ncbi:MAG: hypothetical protein HY026_06575 [Deltaproteobacteria bacterium]|nr:hypothetical protein [Deltaproteobacteria bacterium]
MAIEKQEIVNATPVRVWKFTTIYYKFIKTPQIMSRLLNSNSTLDKLSVLPKAKH